MANRLASETSPYLLQHADNPVDWYPWSDEAFRQAAAQDMPIFLSVGYAACHWCHVMAHESFENAHVAEYMNEHYINIKVDREERPDVDSIYMDAVVALTGQGGWPMSVFLTPEGAPFFGGTYFPPERRFNRPSFLELLEEIQRLWTEDRERLLKIGADLTLHLRQSEAARNGPELLQPALLRQAAKTLFENYDWRSGGWGAAPKFPQPAAIEFLLRYHRRERDSLALDMARHALDAMAGGGLYDQLGGGFHRYSVDAGWRVPHFEKMLYDNAGLMRSYLHGWLLTGEARYLDIVEGTFAFLQAEMHDPAGGYYASLDADSEGEEGRFYTWKLSEVQRVLNDDRLTSIASAVFGIHPEGNFEGTNVLSSPVPLEQVAREHDCSLEQIEGDVALIHDRLLLARGERVRPATDDKVLSAWNGLLLIALAETAFATQRADVLASSQALASFILDQMVVDGQLMRSWRRGKANVPAFLEDYAAVGLGLLSLYQVDFNPLWLQEAESFTRTILDRFSDPAGGFFDTPAGQEDLIIRPKSIQDSPFPSGNSMAAMLLLQLHAIDGNTEFRQSAANAMSSPAALAAKHPGAFAGWLSDIEFALGTPMQLALVGDPGSSHFQELLAVAARGYYPQMVRAGGLPGDTGAPALLEGRQMQNTRATAYLCQNFTCQLPTDDVEVLARQIEAALAGGRA